VRRPSVCTDHNPRASPRARRFAAEAARAETPPRLGLGESAQPDGILDQLDPMPGSPAPPAKVGSADLWLTVDPLRMEISVNKGGVAQ
jgi:hypothetical protein